MTAPTPSASVAPVATVAPGVPHVSPVAPPPDQSLAPPSPSNSVLITGATLDQDFLLQFAAHPILPQMFLVSNN